MRRRRAWRCRCAVDQFRSPWSLRLITARAILRALGFMTSSSGSAAARFEYCSHISRVSKGLGSASHPYNFCSVAIDAPEMSLSIHCQHTMTKKSAAKAPPPKRRKTAIVQLRIEPSLKEAMDRAAADDRRSLTLWVEGVAIDWLQAHGYLKGRQ